ncbi:MAG TPA: TIGR03618 family F420-dependent PPOX class oxidoreductase [Mycobacteriales bacterium]|nr:TIGR03618 family F420-dependent PPOX class oxidoreductase [Mycobacteriales bacterium]
MSAAEVARFLESSRTAVLVTTGPDGCPDPVGMWYVLDAQGRLRMRTYARSQKARNLERDPRVAVLVETGERYGELRGVQISGRVELDHDPERILDVVAALAGKYEGVESVDRGALADYAGKQVALTVVALRVVSWDFTKL